MSNCSPLSLWRRPTDCSSYTTSANPSFAIANKCSDLEVAHKSIWVNKSQLISASFSFSAFFSAPSRFFSGRFRQIDWNNKMNWTTSRRIAFCLFMNHLKASSNSFEGVWATIIKCALVWYTFRAPAEVYLGSPPSTPLVALKCLWKPEQFGRPV